MTTRTYTVSGMTCDHCIHAVTEELSALPGVQQVQVDLVAGADSAVTVTSEQELPRESVAGALGEAGDYHLATD